jgi:hypothetical protein
MSVEIIEQVTSFSEYMQETSILPKAKNGYWTVSKTKNLKTERFEYHYEYHIEYKDEEDCLQNFTLFNKDFVSGLKQLGLTEEKIIEKRIKTIYYENGVESENCVEIPKRTQKMRDNYPALRDKWQENLDSLKIIQRLPLSIEDIPDINIVPKAKNGYWTVSETNAFDKIKYYDYHIEYKGVKDLEQNFRIKNEDFVSGLKQLGLNEYEICFPRSRNKCYEKGAITIYMN